MDTSPTKYIPFDQPANYRITVQGRIDSSWSTRLGGMVVYHGTGQDNTPITTLEGELTDQAALAGVLITIYELHLLVLSVLCLDA